MELRQLRYFLAVVDAQSITRAARKLHVVQSALSHQVANLEAEIQAELLLRSRNGVQPTEAGMALYRHAQEIIKQVDTIGQSIREMDKEVRGAVTIGLPSSTADFLAVPLLKAVRQELPHVELGIVEGLSGMLSEQLTAGRLDMCMLFETEAIRGFAHVPLLNERLHFVSTIPEAHAAYAGAHAITFKEVTKWPLVLPPKPNGIRVLLEREAARADLQLQVVAELSGMRTMLSAVQTGLASSVTTAANAVGHGRRRRNLLILPIRNPAIDRSIGLFQPQQFSLSVAARSVREVTLRLTIGLVAQGKWLGASRPRSTSSDRQMAPSIFVGSTDDCRIA